jgi:hypothetical protein
MNWHGARLQPQFSNGHGSSESSHIASEDATQQHKVYWCRFTFLLFSLKKDMMAIARAKGRILLGILLRAILQ